MEHMNCALCGKDDAAPVFKTRDRNWRLPGEFTLVRCRVCGLAYLDPRPTPEEMQSYYPEAFAARGAAADKQAAAIERSMECRARPLLNRKQSGKLLDVGCSDGQFLVYMRKLGWSVYGVEPREVSARTAREQFGLDVFHGYVENADFPLGFFDAITLNHVFEHVHNPLEIAGRINELLSPGGIAMIEVPNFASLESRVFGERWVGVDAPRHLYQFTPKTLRATLERGGLRVLEIVQGSDIGPYKMGYSESLRHLISDLGIRKYPQKPLTVAESSETIKTAARESTSVSAGHAIESLVFAAAAAAANAIKMGSRITAIASKE